MLPRWATTPAQKADAGMSASATTVIVKPGDTLWGLAQRHLGDGRRWPELWDLNAEVITAEVLRRYDPACRWWRSERRVRSPHLIFPGTVLMLPSNHNHIPWHAIARRPDGLLVHFILPTWREAHDGLAGMLSALAPVHGLGHFQVTLRCAKPDADFHCRIAGWEISITQSTGNAQADMSPPESR